MKCLATGVAVLCAVGTVLAYPASDRDVIWMDPAVPAMALAAGTPPRMVHEPGTTFRFLSEPTAGTSPKFDVVDERGARWKVKLGEEARAETAAAHLLRLAGYQTDDDYYRAEIIVTGLPRLVRGQQFVSPGGRVRGARLEAAGPQSPSHTWSWFENPFLGSREFNGLRVMMALINNWDLKATNNSAPNRPGGSDLPRVTDLGASLGRTGDVKVRSKGNPADYAAAPFIARVTATEVDFVLHSRPMLLGFLNFQNYKRRARMEQVTRAVPLDDARWIGGVLSRLSPAALADAFRNGGFTQAETDVYVEALQARIAELNRLPASAASGTAPAPGGVAPAELPSGVPRCRLDTCRQAPVRERVTPLSFGTRYARGVFGGFEQGAGIGLGVQLSSADALPGIEVRTAALGSTRLYRRLEFEVLVPHAGSDRMHAAVRLADLRRDVDFSGIGPRSPADTPTHFQLAQRSYQALWSRDLSPSLQAGIYAQMATTMTSPDTGTADIAITELGAGAPGVADRPWLPGLLSETRIRSYGAYVAFDNRDDRRGLTRGLNAYARVADATSPSTDVPGYGWREAEADVRGHIPLWGTRTALLLRARAQLKAPKSHGRQIPFYDLSYLGGRAYLRGYHSYRFRANNVVLLSSELQRTVYALTPVRGIDVLASADAGQVWGDARTVVDPALLDTVLSRRIWRTGVGGGLQYRHSRRVAIRLEAGHSQEGTLIYASLSRGF